MQKKIHLICNAHLDPVWLWEWEEGVAEAVSTFRTAVEICEKNDNFIFNHNEAILYKWIDEYAPDLFKKIQELVRQGKWHIMGGWYLQPDCNMPSGESFIRQIMSGRSYFKKYFNVEPATAINFDPFGHSRGLVQILAKSGYDSYLFGRPLPENLTLPAESFVWVGFDGSKIIAHRFTFPYNSGFGKACEKLKKTISLNLNANLQLMLWGVGNHGGGPSKKDIKEINKFINKNKEYNIVHSTPEKYFKDLKLTKNLPIYKNDLNPWGSGCYTSQIRIKQMHRQLENSLYMSEKMSSTAAVQGLMKYPTQELDEAFNDLMTIQFHDILPGSSVPAVEQYALQKASHGLEIASRIRLKTFFALSTGLSKPKTRSIPIIVYNPHPFKIKQIVECEFNLSDINWDKTFTNIHVYHDNKQLPSQVEQERSHITVDWRKKVAFWAELKPGQMNQYYCTAEVLENKPAPKLKAKRNKITFKTNELNVVINTITGLVDSYRIKGYDCVGRGAFEPIVMKDSEDSWGMYDKSYSKIIGRFKLMNKKNGSSFSGLEKSFLESVRVIEDGPARTVVESVFSYKNSFICQQYKLPKLGTEIEIETRVFWNEKTKMLKLSIPAIGKDNKYIGQVACGIQEFPCDGTEVVAQKWTAVSSQDRTFLLTCINDGIYGSDFSENGLRLTLLRSAAYASASFPKDRPTVPQDRFWPRMDQGERIFRFWFNGGNFEERSRKIDREALAKNESPFALSFYPSGSGKKPRPFVTLSDDVIQILALKKAENGTDFIVRLFEPTGKRRSAILSLPFLNKKMKITLGAFEIKTLKVNNNGKISEVNLMEEKL